MQPIDITSNSYAEYNEDSNEKDPKFKVNNRVRISKHKDIFAKGYTQNRSEEVSFISKIKDTVQWTCIISYLNGEPLTGTFMKNNCRKLVKKNSE